MFESRLYVQIWLRHRRHMNFNADFEIQALRVCKTNTAADRHHLALSLIIYIYIYISFHDFIFTMLNLQVIILLCGVFLLFWPVLINWTCEEVWNYSNRQSRCSRLAHHCWGGTIACPETSKYVSHECTLVGLVDVGVWREEIWQT